MLFPMVNASPRDHTTVTRTMIRVAVVEDDPRVRAALVARCRRETGFTAAGAWESADDAARHADWRRIDVLVVDLELPGSLSAIGLIGRARETNRHILPIVHTIHDARDMLFAAIHAGAVGYVLKGESLDTLVDGILDAVEGRAPISPAVARYLVEAFRAEVPAGDVKPLTDRETELLRALAAGLTYADVADRMGISRHTVHSHAKKIYDKLHARGSGQAIRKAKLSGLLDPPAEEMTSN
jgi:two-component system NarL family response regulator